MANFANQNTEAVYGGSDFSESIRDRVTWSTLDALLVLILAFVIYIVGSLMVGLVAIPFEGRHLGFWVIPISYLFLTLGVWASTQWWIVGRRGASWHTVGFRLPPANSLLSAIGRILLIALGSLVLVEIGANLITDLFNAGGFRIKSNVKELLPPGQSHIDLAQYLALVLVGSILAPVTEETLFRGVLFQGMKRDADLIIGRIAGLATAALISGTIFGAFHLIGGSDELHTLPILVYLGILLAVTFHSARSLGSNMLVHATVNFISITYLYSQAH